MNAHHTADDLANAQAQVRRDEYLVCLAYAALGRRIEALLGLGLDIADQGIKDARADLQARKMKLDVAKRTVATMTTRTMDEAHERMLRHRQIGTGDPDPVQPEPVQIHQQARRPPISLVTAHGEEATERSEPYAGIDECHRCGCHRPLYVTGLTYPLSGKIEEACEPCLRQRVHNRHMERERDRLTKATTPQDEPVEMLEY